MSIVRRITHSQLVRGSLFVFVASNIVSFGNFLYNLFMGRLLGPALYGNLGAIFSLLVLLTTPLSLVSLIMVKTVSVYWGQEKRGVVKALLKFLTPRFFILGILVSLLLILGSSVFAAYLNLDNRLPIIIIFLYFIFSFPSVLNKAALSGTLSFLYIAVNSFVEIGLKLLISVVLVIFNFQLIGALLGPLIGAVAGYILTVIELKFILEKTEETVRPSLGKLFTPSVYIFLATFSLTLFLSADIILVRYFFTPGETGEYVALSTVGKIIYYCVGPVISVMFPTISNRVSKDLPYILPLFGTLALSLGIASILIFVYFLFPKFIIGILFGSLYFGIIPYLGLFSFFITLYTVNSILTYFLLSISYYRPILLLPFISLLQSIFIIFFHRSFNEIIWVNIAVSILYLLTVSYFVIRREKGRLFLPFLVGFTDSINKIPC